MRKGLRFITAYREFCRAEGSQHIASEFAIGKIKEIVNYFRVKRILEVGLGIGSISGVVLALNRDKAGLVYAGTEANEFCLKALPKNLKGDYARLRIFSNLDLIDSTNKFELIIVDGIDQHINKIKNLISKNGILAIEGDRIPQQHLLQRTFPNHKYVHCISLRKNKVYSPFPPANWQGGLKVIFINPTWLQIFWWFKEKIVTKIKYKYPGRYIGVKS